jgi:hypothetical protein
LRVQLSAPRRLAAALVPSLLAVAAVGTVAHAEPVATAEGRTSLYQDDDETTISTTVVALSGRPVEELSISGRYLADIISSASVDVTSSASQRASLGDAIEPWEETRHEGAGGVGYADGTHTAGLGYVYSVEHDWRSHTGSASYSQDILNHMITLGGGVSFTTNDIGRAGDPSFHEDGKQGSLTLSSSFVLSRADVVSVAYTLVYVDGYNASPYRFVRFKDPTNEKLQTGSIEAVPDVRVRHAVGMLWNHHMFRDTVIRSQLRGYTDDWGVMSVTAGTEYVVGFSPFEVGVFARGYAQTGASFYQDIYDAPRRYMTADRELSPFADVFGGLRLLYRSGPVWALEDLKAELQGTVFDFEFFDFARLPKRQGYMVDFALGVSL